MQNYGLYTCSSAMIRNIEDASQVSVFVTTLSIFMQSVVSLPAISLASKLRWPSLASGPFWWLHLPLRWEGTHGIIQDILSSTDVPRTVESHLGWWVYGCICAWHCYHMCQWDCSAILSTNIYLHCWLPWKVSYLCLINILFFALMPSKVLAASIRNWGNCPCPCCMMPLSDVHRMGIKADQSQRHWLVRADTLACQTKVECSISLIHKDLSPVDAMAIESLLCEESLVPTAVCILLIALF